MTVAVAQVSKPFGANQAVADPAFEVKGGEVFGLLGPVGAGQTTTLCNDRLQALPILSRLGPLTDPRPDEARDWLQAKRDAAAWPAPDGCYWRRPGRSGSQVEVVDGGRRGPHPLLTLNGRRVLRAAGGL